MALNLDPAVLDFIRRKQGLPAEPKLGLEFDWGGDPADPVEAPVVPPPAQPKAAPFADESKAVAELEAIDAERNRSNALGYLGQTFSRAGSMVRGDKVGPLPAPPQVDDSIRKFILTRKLGAGAKPGEAPVTDAEVAALVKAGIDPQSAAALRADPGTFRKTLADHLGYRKPGEEKTPLVQHEAYVKRGAALKSPVLPTMGEKPADFAKRVEEQERLEGKGAKELTDSQRESAMKLRQEFMGTPTYKATNDMVTMYDKLMAADPSPAGDLSMVFAYMKLLDPGSAVKESEYASAANAAGVPERVRTWWNKLKDGEKLGEEQRADFKRQASKLVGSQHKAYKRLEEKYAAQAERVGVPKDAVIFGIDYTPFDQGPVPAPGAPAPGDKYLPKE